VPDKAGRTSRRRSGGTGFRRETDLRRSSGNRQERRTVLIVTNGERTEVGYFEALRKEPWVTVAKVTVKFEAGAPGAVVNRAAKIRDDSGYNEAWGVCDVDEFDVTSAIESAATQSVGLALSVPSFEVWLILHIAKSCPGFNTASQVEAYLKKLLTRWDKARLDFRDFRTGVPEAVARAKRLGDPPKANPSTSVWRLVESLGVDDIP
jgi:RloB-like protein